MKNSAPATASSSSAPPNSWKPQSPSFNPTHFLSLALCLNEQGNGKEQDQRPAPGCAAHPPNFLNLPSYLLLPKRLLQICQPLHRDLIPCRLNPPPDRRSTRNHFHIRG